MAITSIRYIYITFTGDIVWSQTFPAAQNAASTAQDNVVDLQNGANTITVPSSLSGPAAPTAVTIIPPKGNTTSLTLKGVTGDTGVRLNNTDPTSIALDPGVTSFVLTCGGSVINGTRFIWS